MTDSPLQDTNRLTRLRVSGGLGGVLAIIGFTLSHGASGTVVGLLILIGWYLAGGPYAITIGAIGLIALGIPTSIPLTLAVLVGLLVLLADSLRALPAVWRTRGAFTIALAALAILVHWGGRTLEDTWLLALTLAVAITTSAYALHRYETVVVHAVPEEDTT